MAIAATGDVSLAEESAKMLGDEIDTFPTMDTYLSGLLAKVDAGEISEKELDDSVYRILELKKEKGI